MNVAGTIDGGLSLWIKDVAGKELVVHQHSGYPGEDVPEASASASTQLNMQSGDSTEALQGFCHCGTVRFHVTRPNDSSRLPTSNMADLMVPYHTGSSEIKNPHDLKWWLQPEDALVPTRYLAGTCACRSCRLISGFEIQTWAFIPRSNIIFHIADTSNAGAGTKDLGKARLMPLDFSTLPEGILRSYESSPGVLRESCVKCGATVFWHDKWRPDLIDVSVGLLDAPEGTRAEEWLKWWKARVSFSEDVSNGRSGMVAARAKALVESLERGLKG
ncbi:uncharacterized protein JN550_006649 [Neoarthrinium moseri]|uniref:uncharacterized protein n=1 Tax=Neoarthrinium moseri TaxID=1658444 RepID=UPI001FDE1B7D|nr:uncharacterized protein JN550_006649 [Neoarthrinium moseri]KAI1867842.1 hypothetical protein JN550_006649 [Neoarthrinium moseri]